MRQANYRGALTAFALLACALARAQAEAPAPAADTGQAASAPPVAAEAFDVWEYRVLGNSVLPAREVERAVYPYLGQGRTFADVESARAALESAYRQLGYGTVFVDLPEQGVGDGIIRLRVTEGRVDRVRVAGARYYSQRRIRAQMPSVASGEIPKIPQIQAEINAFNKASANRSVVPVLKAGRTPGTVDISLRVADEHPWHGAVEMTDRYTAQTSKLRASVMLSYDNLWQLEHSLALQYQTAPRDRTDVEAMVASYAMPLHHWPDTTLALYAVDSKTDVATLGNINVLGNGNIYGARLIHSLEPQTALNSSLQLGLDYKDFLEDIQLADATSLTTPIRYLNWSMGYSGNVNHETHVTGFGVTANFGIRRVINDTEEFLDKRFKGRANYFYVRGNLQQQWMMPARFQVAARVAAQYSPTPLISNEQFGIGGADTVRGYLESSQLGDYGFNGTLELRNDELAALLSLPRGAAYASLFYDAGIVTIQDPLPRQARTADLASFGAAIRISAWHGLDLDLAWAHALTPSGDILAGDERIHFLMRFGF